MGNKSSGQQNMLEGYQRVKEEHEGYVVMDDAKVSYFVKEYCFADEKQYRRELERCEGNQSTTSQFVLNVLEVKNQQYQNLCSNSYKLYVMYEYPPITLLEEIHARQKEQKYFEEHELWAILQSCANGLMEVNPALAIHPKFIFIAQDGLLKILHNDMISPKHRCLVDEFVYYAPEKLHEFTKTDTDSSLQKQGIFSLGMTILHAALLQPLYECYDYEKLLFHSTELEARINEIKNKYSEQLVEILSMLLEQHPNKRSSLMEVKGIVTEVWNTEENSKLSENEKTNSKVDENESIEANFEVASEQVSGQKEQKESWSMCQPPAEGLRFNQESNSESRRSSNNILTEITNKGNSSYLFTDPKLLQMIRNDLHDLSELKKSTMRPAPYSSSPHIPSAYSILDNSYHSHSVLSQNVDHVQYVQHMQHVHHGQEAPQVQYVEQMQSMQNGESFTYDRMFKKGKKEGVFVVEDYEDGRRFEGMVVGGVKEGPGKLIYEDGAYYEGQFKKDQMWGKGTLYYGRNKPAYEGEWYEDQFEGQGTLHNECPLHHNGSFNYQDFDLIQDYWVRYQGQFHHDAKQGKGKLYLSNGQYFEGSFENDCVNGLGTFVSGENEVVRGVWMDNKLIQLCD